MGILSWFGIGSEANDNADVAAQQAAADAVAYAPPPQAVNDSAADVVGYVNGMLTQAFQHARVKALISRTGAPNASFLMPVKSVELGGVKQEGGHIYAERIGSAAHESATITLHLSDKAGNYNMDSLNNAIHAVLGSIPALHGKVEFAKDIAVQKIDHATIWKQLHPLLTHSGKFSAAEIKLIGEYFENTKHLSAENPDWGHMSVEHSENGKVQIHFNHPEKLKTDEKSAISPDAVLIEYLNKPEHKESILKVMREKVAALNVLTPEEIAALDYTAAEKGADWPRPTLEFGSKPHAPETALGATALTKIEKEKLQTCFTDALLESGKELPAIFSRIADGAMVRHVVQQRLGDNPAVKAALNHPMFNTQAEQSKHYADMEKRDIVTIGNAVETDKPNELSLTFALPHGVDLEALRTSIIKGQQQMAVQQQRALAAANNNQQPAVAI